MLDKLVVFCEYIHPTISIQCKRESAERRTEGTDWEGGRKKSDAYMFLSFDPLVSLLNGLQVLKMQLHQSINLESEWNECRQRESERCSKQQSNEKNGRNMSGKGESTKRQNKMRLGGQIWKNNIYFLHINHLMILFWTFAANLVIVTGRVYEAENKEKKYIIIKIQICYLNI